MKTVTLREKHGHCSSETNANTVKISSHEQIIRLGAVHTGLGCTISHLERWRRLKKKILSKYAQPQNFVFLLQTKRNMIV